MTTAQKNQKPPEKKKINPDNQITVALVILLLSVVGICAVSLFLYLWYTGTTLF